VALRERAAWVAETFGDLSQDQFRQIMNSAFGRWIEEFQIAERSLARDV
jgi:hypothetical protein